MWSIRYIILIVLICPSMAHAYNRLDRPDRVTQSVVRIVAEDPNWIAFFREANKQSSGFIVRRIVRENKMYGHVIVASLHGVVTEKGNPMRVRVKMIGTEAVATVLATGCRVYNKVAAVVVRDVGQGHPLCVADVSLLYVEMPTPLPVVRIDQKSGRNTSFCAIGYAIENRERISHQCSRTGKILTKSEWFYSALGIGIGVDVSPGMSGGPIVNSAQSVIGVTVFRRSAADCLSYCSTVARTVYGGNKPNKHTMEYIRDWSWGVPIQVVCAMYGVCGQGFVLKR